jgi:hypothetical protein
MKATDKMFDERDEAWAVGMELGINLPQNELYVEVEATK